MRLLTRLARKMPIPPLKTLTLVRISVVAVSTAILAACTSTGVVPMGGSTYMIAGSRPGFIGTGEVKAALIKEASAWCAKRGLVMIVVDATGHDGVAGHNAANADVTFKALPPTEAEKAGSAYQAPTQIIETRAR
jgi:hypothetical protein